MGAVWVNERVRVDAAIIAGESSQMDATANRLMRNIQALALQHRLTGDFIDSFSVERVPGLAGTGREVTDRIVVSSDPGATSINYGHIVRHKNARRVTYVPGIHVFERGMRTM